MNSVSFYAYADISVEMLFIKVEFLEDTIFIYILAHYEITQNL